MTKPKLQNHKERIDAAESKDLSGEIAKEWFGVLEK